MKVVYVMGQMASSFAKFLPVQPFSRPQSEPEVFPFLSELFLNQQLLLNPEMEFKKIMKNWIEITQFTKEK